jgi:hypothetical protein
MNLNAVKIRITRGEPTCFADAKSTTTGQHSNWSKKMSQHATWRGQPVRVLRYKQTREVDFARKSLQRLQVVCGIKIWSIQFPTSPNF